MLKNERGPGFLDLFRPCRVIQPGVSGFPLFLRQAFTIRQDGGDFGFYFVMELCCGVAYGASPDNDALYSRRFRALCGEDYRLYEAAATLQLCSANCILWDDPLQGTVLLGCEYRKILPDYCKKLERLLTDLNRRPVLSGQLQTVRVLAALLLSKIRLRKALLAAYSS